ncbi:MAG: hypothetical protein L0027_00460 [Candidatus Rokubacteria bacterium]|nr:hypothetical protein [Candidatus Rokubacteria bacterium]
MTDKRRRLRCYSDEGVLFRTNETAIVRTKRKPLVGSGAKTSPLFQAVNPTPNPSIPIEAEATFRQFCHDLNPASADTIRPALVPAFDLGDERGACRSALFTRRG